MSGNGNGPPRADTLRVLLATDNHLGYAEKDPVRGDDSFRAFQEILQLARDERVDLLLLAGDLFHENKPSRKTMYQTMRLLRSYCMGDGAVQFQIVSDQSINFPNFGTVNYEDPNFNIELPVFSIHGNHDDPAREAGGAQQSQQSLAALDLLSAANLVNYFGKSEKADAIEVFPILLNKGETKVAIYGLGSMRDERLNRMFAQQKVVFRRPAENPEQWFSVFVVHQNRDDRGRGAKNCLPESFIPDFIDFVVWGHEHECLVDVQESLKGDFFITQPGSSVATSLVEGEAKTKQVAILEIHQQNFRLSSRVLKSVRPFKLGEISLSEVEDLDPNDPDVTSKIRDVLEERVLELLAQAEEENPNRPPELKEVLVRVRVEHTGFPVLVNQRFGSRFVGKVANPNDILLFYRRKKPRASTKGDVKDTLSSLKDSGLGGSLRDPIRPARLADSVTIEDLLGEQLRKPDQTLSFLPEGPLALALEDYIVKSIPSALDEFVNGVLESTRHELESTRDAKSRQAIIEAVEKKKDKDNAEHLLQQEEAEKEAGTQGSARGRRDGLQESLRSTSQSQTQPTQGRRRADSLDDDEDLVVDSPPKKGRGKAASARTTATKSKPPAKTKRGAAAKRRKDDDDDDDDDKLDDDEDEYDGRSSAAARKRKPAATPPARKTTARAASTKAKAKQRSLYSDDDLGDDDGDEDYEMDEDDSELVSQAPSTPARRGKAASAVKTTARKRLRKAESDASEDDDDFTASPAPARRAAPKAKAPAKKSAVEEVDLCSSEGEEAARATKPAARAKPTPQPKISDMFRKQQPKKQKQDDDIESDPEFTQLTNATAATVGGGGRLGALAEEETASEAAPSQSQSQFLSQFQSQASQSSGVKKRKLPLSMLAASQSTPTAKQVKKDGAGDASALRKGWGRTRR